MGQVRTRLLALSAVAGLALLAGCTDPAPSGSDDGSASPTDDASATPSDTDTPADTETSPGSSEPAQAPVFAPSATANAVNISSCVPEAFGEELSYLSVLTAIDDVTIADVTAASDSGVGAYEVLDAFVLPLSAGGAGTTIAPFPPEDPAGERQDADGYVLTADTTVLVGLGVTAAGPDPVTLSLAVAYEGGDGAVETTTSTASLTLADRCDD